MSVQLGVVQATVVQGQPIHGQPILIQGQPIQGQPIQSQPIQGQLVQVLGYTPTITQQLQPTQQIQVQRATSVHPGIFPSTPSTNFTPPSNGLAFNITNNLNIPNNIITPSGKPYCENDLYIDVEAKPQSAWFGVDPIRGTMGNRSAKLWPKIFSCIVCCQVICNFFVIVTPACGYFCSVLGGKTEFSQTAWDMYIPCNSTCAHEDTHCEWRRAQWTEVDYLDNDSISADHNNGIGRENLLDCYDGHQANKGQPGNPSKRENSGFTKEDNLRVQKSRWSRVTPAGNILINACFILIAWPCCWGGAFLPAYISTNNVAIVANGQKKKGNPHHPCGPLNGPNTSRLLFTILSLFNALTTALLLPSYFSPQLLTNYIAFNYPGYLALSSVLFYLFGASRFVLGTVLVSAPNRNTHASLTGFIAVAIANVIQMAGLVLLTDLGRTPGEDGNVDPKIFLPPMLLFFFMLIYLACGRCFFRYVLAYCATHSDKQRYDKLWSTAKVQMQSAPASYMQASKHGRKVLAHRPPNQMFYVDGISPNQKNNSKLTQPFDGDHHPHARMVALFHFAGVANTLFQQYINEWSVAVPGTHSKNSPVKSPVRAVQKLQRSYGLENALRLLDLVRASVVCPDLHMLERVVDVIHNDERVKVLREKNAWAKGFKSPTGYRNYQIIVQLRNPLCAGFLCEIQLDLQSFHDEKNRPGSSGHANYKKRRNYMGE
jgi:hypothetical protein